MNINGDYIFDLDKVLEFIFEPTVLKGGDSEITEIYGRNEATNVIELQQKQLREVKSSEDSAKAGVRYDLFKTFLEVILSIDPEDVTFGEGVILNSLADKGLLKKIE